MPFEYWTLEPGTDDEKTRIIKVTKENKYLNFYRDDGKVCKFDLSNGETIGFSGKPVKSLSSQLKDLTTRKLIDMIEDLNYQRFLSYVFGRTTRSRHRAHIFITWALPPFLKYEQFFAAGLIEIDGKLKVSFDEIPKGLIKICREHQLPLTQTLYERYLENVDIFNLYNELDLKNISYAQLNEAVLYNNRSMKREKLNHYDLTMRDESIDIRHRPAPKDAKSFFLLLVSKYGYKPKLLMNYYDSLCVDKRYLKDDFFREMYDYVNMMSKLHDNYDKYPNDFYGSFLRACKEYNNLNIDYDEKEYRRRNVLDYECEIDGFKFIYPKSTAQIKQEGIDQSNCVATYIENVLSEKCHIMFMRPVNDVNHSYITLEIRNNKIVQAKKRFNQEPSDEEWNVIKKWNKKYKKFELK